MSDPVGEARWTQLSEVIAQRTGLYFPPERRDDLLRGVTGAAQEFGIDNVTTCVDWLLATPPSKAQLQVLANHLTIGETYFFRDRQTLDAISGQILPALIRARRGREQRLRIWSAACCSGEEPYSLAILLQQMLPDLQDWHVTITATDINGRFLHKAAAGTYGEWSFRNAPTWLKARYFNRTADGRYAVIPEIKRLVTFAHLNLVEDHYPSLSTDTNAMDVILCRNVLMYFMPSQIEKVIGNLHHALVDGGWLAVSPSEAAKALFPQFASVNFPGAILFRKAAAGSRYEHAAPAAEAMPPFEADWVPGASAPWRCTAVEEPPTPVVLQREPVLAEPQSEVMGAAEALYREGRYGEAATTVLAAFGANPAAPEACSLLARAMANQGKLADALTWCDRWVAAHKLDPAAHYLRAIVLLEQGEITPARASLQRALYLDHDFVLAHFALGNLARSLGSARAADRHFDHALRLLARHAPADILADSDGLTAGRLIETITSIRESTP